jgi:Lon protease-like protein
MEELGLFPLGIVLLPTERIPLHIFEPRYKELIGECLDDGRDFGMLFVDEDGLRRIGTRARVVTVLERFDDGRLNIIVEGRERFLLASLTEGRSFHTAAVLPLSDDEAATDAAASSKAVEAFRRVAKLAEVDIEDPDAGSPQLSFELAARVELPVGRKQELLELRSEPARLRLVSELLADAARALVLERELRERASRNGERPIG